MKYLSLIILFITTSFSFAAPQRERLFHCLNFGPREHIEELFIVKSSYGQKVFYEVEVPFIPNDHDSVFFRRLNLIEKYRGRVLLFTTGNYRVEIDRVFPQEGKYEAFVRLPRFEVHSRQWMCKDY